MPTCPAEICVLSFLPQHVSTAQYLHVGPATSVLTCLGPGHCHTAMAARAVWKLFGFKQKEEEVKKISETLQATTEKLEESKQLLKTNENGEL